MKRIIIGNGKVANIIKNHNDILIGHDKIEISNIDSVQQSLKWLLNPDTIVINTAAKISLEWCEHNKLLSHSINTNGPLNLLEICSSYGAKFVQVSSGCIFDGNHVTFTEDMTPKPAAWYAMTKTWADELITNFGYQNYLILRPRQLISPVPNATNMLTKFLNLRKLSCIDEPNSITCIEDFSDMIDHLLSINATGIYNCANVGEISPYQIAINLQKIDKNLFVEKINYENYLKTISVKRVNTILDLSKLINSGYTPRSAQEALDWCINNYGI